VSSTMCNHTRVTLLVLTLALALTGAVGSAAARRIESSERWFLALFRELTFESGSGPNVICGVNLEGSFHSRTLSKVREQLIGYITEARIQKNAEGACLQGGRAWTLNGVERINGVTTTNTLPWHIVYNGFTGTLPNISGIIVLVINDSFLIEAGLGITCLYKSTAEHPLEGTIHVASGEVTELTPMEEFRVRLFSGTFGCPSEAAMRGTGTVGTQTSWRPITVRLVQ
jgi:hypothetical protein